MQKNLDLLLQRGKISQDEYQQGKVGITAMQENQRKFDQMSHDMPILQPWMMGATSLLVRNPIARLRIHPGRLQNRIDGLFAVFSRNLGCIRFQFRVNRIGASCIAQDC